MTKPDPEKPFEGYRRADAGHARTFATYWRENTNRQTPPVLLDVNVELTFTSMFPAGGVETGILSLPHNSGNIPDILDVQHRVLGWAYAYAVDAIASDLQGAREQMILSKRAEDNVSVGVWRAKIDTLFEQEQRLRGEYVTTALVEGITLVEHKQALPDITVLHRFQWWV